MDLKTLGTQWNELGRLDPMWAVMSWPGKAGGLWQADEFFATGRAEIDALITYLSQQKRAVTGARALDFGCGLGRLSQALARHFESVDGVDIAPSMVERARLHNQFGNNVHYHLNVQNDLGLFPADRFDLIYSSITLQHIAPEYSRSYLAEFVRVLKPGGTLVFQIPSHPAWTPKGLLWRFLPLWLCGFLLRLKNKSSVNMEMHGIPKGSVQKLISRAGGRIMNFKKNSEAGSDWVSYLFMVTK